MRLPRSAAAVVSAAALILVLAGCAPAGTALPEDGPTVGQTTTPDPDESADAPVEEQPPADPKASTLSADDYTNIAGSISSGNTAALEGYLANPSSFVIAASECCEPQTPFQTISGLDYLTTATAPWTYPVAETVVDSYRNGSYADHFPAGAFVMASSDADPFIVSFTIEGHEIVGIFIAAGASLLTD